MNTTYETQSCPIPELPTVGCVVPATASPTPTPSPSPSPSAAPTPTVSAAPVPTFTPAPVVTGAPVPVAVAAPPPSVPLVVVPVVAPSPVPVLAATSAPVAVVTTPAAAPVVPLSSVVPSAYAIVVFGVIGVALLVSFLSGLKPTGGTMKTTRTRLWAGLAVIAAAAVVGGVGWYRISGEPLLNRQVPFLASAGIAVVVLAVLGGALIVAEQLRTDQNRIGELEDAVRTLTERLSPLVEQPPRRMESDALVQ